MNLSTHQYHEQYNNINRCCVSTYQSASAFMSVGDVSANTMDIILSLACKLIEQLILVKTHGQLNDIKNIHCLITARQQEILSSQKPFVSWSHESFKKLKKTTDFNIPSILSFMWKTIEKMVYKNSIQRMVIEVWD